MKLPRIETRRLVLREAAESDLNELYSIYSNPDVVRYTGDTLWTEEQEANDFLDGVHEGLEEQALFGWCVELKETKRVIGTCALFDCELEKRVAEISYEIHPDYWQQGYTGEFLPPLIEFAFKTLDLNRISAFVDSRNTASLKLLTKNNFQHEGIMRESWVDEEGTTADDHVMGLLRREWTACIDK